MLPTTEFSNLRRSTTIAECVMAVAPPCKSITLNSDCYFPRKRFPLLEPESSSLLGGAVAANFLVIGG